MQKRQSWSGPLQSTIYHYWVAAVQDYTSEKTSSQLASINWVQSSTSAMFVQRVFFRLRQLRFRWSLYSESAATLVHAFVVSSVDYCNAVFAGAPRNITDRLQRVLNAAAHVVSHTQKFDHGLSRLMHTKLHWPDVPEQVKYKLSVLMYQCQHDWVPWYLTDHCSPVSDVVFRQHLVSASSHQLFIPHYWLSTYGSRAFFIAAPTVTMPTWRIICQSQG